MPPLQRGNMINDHDMSGILFRNETKVQPNHPDYKGNITVWGESFWLSGWIKESKTGKGKFLSLVVKPKEEKKAEPQSTAKPEDAMPF